ncbi:MAG TPA: glycosyltransferase family 2 protein, partial [Mycobacteriales bacterium]|nr:glycosyltransferase family 2 protein [Mycobacteriales bacterium]
MRPDLSVVIVAYNSAHVIGDLLDSLPAALAGLSADVVVVDNSSADGTAELVEARGSVHGAARVVRSANVGFAGGINRGVHEAAPADAVLVLNPDVRLGAGAVPPLLAALRLPSTGVVAPRILSEDGTLFPSLRREPSLARAMGLNRTGSPLFSEYVAGGDDYSRPAVADWALGAVLLFSRACFDALGGWDESYFLYSEETDFCLRARDSGFLTRYTPDSVAVHLGAGSGQTSTTHAMQILNRVRLYRRRHGVVQSAAYYALTVVSEVSWVARGAQKSHTSLEALL